jgi:hypothetical protein
MIFEKDGKFYEKIEVEREISEMEYLRRKVKELEERLNATPGTITICPCPGACPNTGSPYYPYQPIIYTSDPNVTVTCRYDPSASASY